MGAASAFWHVIVAPRSTERDGHGKALLRDIRQSGFRHLEAVHSSRIYLLAGDLDREAVDLLARDLLVDRVAESYTCGEGLSQRHERAPAIEIHYRPGVMNPVALSTLDAARRLLRAKGPIRAAIRDVQTARRYEIIGANSADELEQVARRVLANDCVEHIYVRGLGRTDRIPDEWPTPPQRPFAIRHVALRWSNDEALVKLSREAHLFLSLGEIRAIRDYYVKVGRDPTDLELETLAQTWSEHCVHKTLKSAVEYTGEDFGRTGNVSVRFDNLLKETIVHATKTLARDWCLSVFVDNAGVIAFDDEFGIAFKVETHNHPSAIEPYGGAATGVGGCIRDIMGCGLGAKPIASTDVFCVAPGEFPTDRLPKDVLHPRRVLKGVVSGVRDYGNRMGIPTVNGAVHFHERYLANPLVFCGCIGLIPRKFIQKKPNTGDRIVVAGGRTGRDGIHGATFSSAELTDSHADEFAHAVQIGNAIVEKKLLDAQLIARDHPTGCLYSSVTDCGAGGLSSAIGEMAEDLGAVVDLEHVPLKYAGLRYDEIWISEAQERMVFAVPPERLDTFLNVFASEEVEATVIGQFSDDRVLRVRYNQQTVGELDLHFLHNGLPKATRRAEWTVPPPSPANDGHERAVAPTTPTNALLAALREPNVASKEWIIRQYDHEVQGRTVIKPLVGPGFGPSDAAVLRPVYNSTRGIAIGCGLCPELGNDDPYWMAVLAVDEALRNVVCVGANPTRIAILDNFCWPKVDTPETLGTLVRACRGASDAAIAYGLPFISGKDSLNNEFNMSDAESRRTGLPRRLAIPPTLLISALGIIDDIRRCVSMDLKIPGNCLALASAPVNQSGFADAFALHVRVADLIRTGKVVAAHDVSDGGLGVALAEMCLAGECGAAVEWNNADFSFDPFRNAPTTYVLEMQEADARQAGLLVLGHVQRPKRLSIRAPFVVTGIPNKSAIDVSVADLAEAWRSGGSNEGG